MHDCVGLVLPCSPAVGDEAVEVALLWQLEDRRATGVDEANLGRADSTGGLKNDDDQRHGQHCGGQSDDKRACLIRAIEPDERFAPLVLAANVDHGAQNEAAD